MKRDKNAGEYKRAAAAADFCNIGSHCGKLKRVSEFRALHHKQLVIASSIHQQGLQGWLPIQEVEEEGGEEADVFFKEEEGRNRG